MPTQLTPKFRQWSSSWEVYFPKRGHLKGQRRFFPTEADANSAIAKWNADAAPSSYLSMREVDQLTLCKSMLPSGVTLLDAVRFYLEHSHSGVRMTLAEVAKAYLQDLKVQKRSEDYRATMESDVAKALAGLGADRTVDTLKRHEYIAYIKSGETFWVRYGRKRAVSCLISKARELGAVGSNALEGFTFEDAPKATPHTLTLSDTQAILEFTLKTRPDLLPSLAFKLFAGIRTEELCRNEVNGKRPLLWEDVTVGQSINVPIEVSKTNERRVVDFWPEALTFWLNASPLVFPGRICPVAELDNETSRLIVALNKARVLEGLKPVDFQQNDFRRTYASMSYAVRGGEKTADSTGHSLKVLKKHYRDFKTETEAKAYFSLKPLEQSPKVVAMTA